MIRRPPRSTLDRSSAASDVYKRQGQVDSEPEVAKDNRVDTEQVPECRDRPEDSRRVVGVEVAGESLSLIHISEPTRPY